MSISQLNQLRETFQIPDSVTIIAEHALIPPAPRQPAAQPEYNIDQTDTRDPELYRSTLGTPVYANIEFLAGQYYNPFLASKPGQDPLSYNNGPAKLYGPMKLEAVLMTVTQSKKIIKTEIQGRNGTAKEYIGMDDFVVNINGIIAGPNGHWPVEDVIKLKTILDAPVALEVASRYLQNLGIHYLVVEGYTFEQKSGGYSYQTFSIQCLSDTPMTDTPIIPDLIAAAQFLKHQNHAR